MEARLAAAALALALLLAPAAAQPKSFPTLVDAGAREASHPAAGVCACVDKGINTAACVGAVKDYCTGTAPDAPKVCAYFRGLINDAGREASMKAAAFLGQTCAVKAPLGSNACACLEVRARPEARGAPRRLVRGARPVAWGAGRRCSRHRSPPARCGGTRAPPRYRPLPASSPSQPFHSHVGRRVSAPRAAARPRSTPAPWATRSARRPCLARLPCPWCAAPQRFGPGRARERPEALSPFQG
jgi:hypothetical protein